MGLIDRITRLWRRDSQTDRGRTTSDELRKPSMPSSLANRFKAESDRRSVILDCRKMYSDDDRAEGVISTLARDAVRGGFTVTVSGGANASKAQTIAEELVARLRLFKRLDDWIRLTLRDGDSLLEVSVNDSNEIVEVTRKPTLQMHRNSNEYDRFEDPTKAFWWADEIWAGQAAPKDAVWFAEWQVIHARWHHDEGNRYGRPLFASARKPWKRMDEGEFDIAIRRKTRAGMKFLHSLEDADDADIQRYREDNKDALTNPFAAVADFFTNKKATITTVQGDARLSDIEDVLHHIRTWWVASPVPMSLMGYGQDLNRDVLEKQKQQYDEALPLVTGWVEEQIVVPLLELQWLLQGIWPGGLTYEVVWASKKVLTATDVRDLADALVKLRATQLFPDETLLTIAAVMLPNVDLDAAREALEQAQAEEDRFALASEEARGRFFAPGQRAPLSPRSSERYAGSE